MKKCFWIFLLAGLMAAGIGLRMSQGAPITAITNYTGAAGLYVFIPGTNADVGTTGLNVSTAYVCFALSEISNLASNEAVHEGGDIRALIYGLNKMFYDAIQAQDSTNRPAKLTMSESVVNASGADFAIIHKIQTDIDIDSVTHPSE